MKYCRIYVTILLCLNILRLKAINEITARKTRTRLCKHDVIKLCSTEYLTIQIELVLPAFFQLLDRSQNYRIFNVKADKKVKAKNKNVTVCDYRERANKSC